MQKAALTEKTYRCTTRASGPNKQLARTAETVALRLQATEWPTPELSRAAKRRRLE